MLKKVFLVIDLILFAFAIKAQGVEYRDVLCTSRHLLAIRADGRLIAWNLDNLERMMLQQDTTVRYLSIGQNHRNELYLGTNDGRVFQLNPQDFSTRKVATVKRKVPVRNICFSRSGEMYLVVPNVLYDPARHRYWEKFDHRKTPLKVTQKRWFFFRKRTYRYFLVPGFVYADSRDRLWMFNHFGEFGGAIQCFDMRQRKPIDLHIEGLNLGLFFPQSAFEDDQKRLYISSGVQHMGNSGEILQITDQNAVRVFDGESVIDSTNADPFNEGLFVGPGAFHQKERKIYFATQRGIYRATLQESGQMNQPEWVFKPEIKWTSEQLAVGHAMAYRKLMFTSDGKLIFLTKTSGIGIFDGLDFRMLP